MITLSPEKVDNGLSNKTLGISLNQADADSITMFAFAYDMNRSFVLRELLRIGVDAFNAKYANATI